MQVFSRRHYRKSLEIFKKSAVEVSHYNDIPAGISFFTILGQIVKDFIVIPNGRSIEDSRVHFCWVQTSGTGKSTLWNFVGPVANKTFERLMVNQHPAFMNKDFVDDIMARTFNTFGVTDYTDSVLIGRYDKDEDELLMEMFVGKENLAFWKVAD